MKTLRRVAILFYALSFLCAQHAIATNSGIWIIVAAIYLVAAWAVQP